MPFTAMASSPRHSPAGGLSDAEYGDRRAPPMRSQIVKPLVDSDTSPSRSPGGASPATDDTDSGHGARDRPAVARTDNGYDVRSPGRRGPVRRSPPDKRNAARFRASSVEPRSPYAGELRRNGPDDRVMDRERGGMRDRERDESGGRVRDADQVNVSGRSRDFDRGREFDRDRGSQRDSERREIRGGSREGFRATDRREPDYHRSRDGVQSNRNAPAMPMRKDYKNKLDDRDRDRDRGKDRYIDRDRDSRDRNGAGRGAGGEREEFGDRLRPYNDRDAADTKDFAAYDDNDRRPGDRGRDRGRRGGGGNDLPVTPPLNSIHNATVHSIRPFGIFVRMEGYRNHGLVHLSQVSDHEVTKRDDSEEAKVKALSSVASEGEKVWVKVISVKVEEDGSTKIGCSMKYVSQGDGRDLDPNNIQLDAQQSRTSWKEPPKLKLDAIYNVQCERCGGHGHLKKECYSSGEKQYKLLSDDDDTDVMVQNGIKGEERMPRESSKHVQAPNVSGGISRQLLATGSVGRGRASVQPAWMKHGVGVGGTVAPPTVAAGLKESSGLPDKVTSVEEALAVIAKLKEEKKRRKEERRKKKEKRHRSKKEKNEKHKRRHRDEESEESDTSKEGKKEKHKRRHRDEESEESDKEEKKEKHKRRHLDGESDKERRRSHRKHRA